VIVDLCSACRRDDIVVRVYSGDVRYADGGGLDERGRARREVVRMQAADLFDQGAPAREVASRLRVSAKSAYRW
jgi:putative transposase